MIRLRLHGTAEEVDRMLSHIEADDSITVISQSGKYSDRGNSIGKRCYLDVELKDKKKDNRPIKRNG